MRRLDIILRTCSNSKLENNLKTQNYKRICGDSREEMIFNCLISLIQSINNCNFDIHFTILDDNSSKSFITKVKILLEKCNKPSEIISLKDKGFNNSAYEQFLLASKCEDLVYTVEDDYIHEINAINYLLGSFFHLEDRLKQGIALFPFDCPFRYETNSEQSTILLHDGIRYWRHVSHTTNTIFSKSSFFKDNFKIFENLAKNYPQVNEDHTINTLYKKLFDTDNNKINLFSPIPSIAYHLSYANPVEIKTDHLSWRDLWHNDSKIDLIDGWFLYKFFYYDIVNRLNDDSVIYEIGSWMGKSTIGMALMNKKLNKKCKIHAIDTWQGSDEQKHKEVINNLKNKNTTLYIRFLHNLEIFNVKDSIIPIKKTSIEASLEVKNKSADLVIIDGSHQYNDVLDDIKAWIPKVKTGGILAGDDFSDGWPDVKKAVIDFFGESNFNIHGSTWYKIID